MRLLTMCVVVFVTLFTHANESRAFVRGNELVEWCVKPAEGDYPFTCLGYIMGVFDTIETQIWVSNHESWPGLCIPPEVTRKQKFNVARKYLEDNPGSLHYGAAYLVSLAAIEAFPCSP
ncbi:unnamed protein product [Ectocarpus fasciculatus]